MWSDSVGRPQLLHSPGRSGVVLLMVVGLASAILVIMTAFLARIRSGAEATHPLLAEAQARAMAQAGMMYIQEASRLGWGEEAYGWTDIRDGSLGPRGPRSYDSQGIVDRSAGTNNGMPQPYWYDGGDYADGWPEDSDLGGTPGLLPEAGGLAWPMPGSVLRIDMYAYQVPPYAKQERATYNAIHASFSDWRHDWHAFVTPLKSGSSDSFDSVKGGHDRFDSLWRKCVYEYGHGALQPQPHYGSWASDDENEDGFFGSFEAGMRVGGAGGAMALREDSRDKSWFRIYREVLADHDGPSGQAPVDQVAISAWSGSAHVNKNWSVFVVSAGAGGTRGYRDWAEVVASGAQSEFGNSEAFFDQQLRRERRVWFRVEWSPLQGGAFSPSRFAKDGSPVLYGKDVNYTPGAYRANGATIAETDDLRRMLQANPVGNLKWIQRLPGPPERW